MKSTTSVARKYAVAFMQEAHTSITDKEYGAIVAAKNALEENSFLLQLFSVPTITEHEKDLCIKKLVSHYALPQSLIPLLQLLYAHERMSLFTQVLNAIAHVYQEEHASLVVTIHTSLDVTAQELDIIIKFIAAQTKKTVIASHVITPELIAGIRIESDQFVWDYSVQKQLRSISTK